MVEGFKIRKDVIEYMRDMALRHYKDLTLEEREIAIRSEDPLLMEKVQVVENKGDRALIYYREMENFYDKYINPEKRKKRREGWVGREESIEELGRQMDKFRKDLGRLYGGGGVEEIVYKADESLN